MSAAAKIPQLNQASASSVTHRCLQTILAELGPEWPSSTPQPGLDREEHAYLLTHIIQWG